MNVATEQLMCRHCGTSIRTERGSWWVHATGDFRCAGGATVAEPPLTREQEIQADGERRIAPYLDALHVRIRQMTEATHLNMSELTLVFPKSEWEGSEIRDGSTVLGCRIVFADVPTVMVAAPVPRGPVATLPDPTEEG